MKALNNIYFGYIEILGYKNFETKINSYPKETKEHFLNSLYSRLEGTINSFKTNSNIIWRRYGDGYVIHSPDENIEYLSEIVKKSARLIALSLNVSIPLRIDITQGNLNIDEPDSGLTISGPGWTNILKLESSLNWMGGILYLPNYDGTHHPSVQNLIGSTNLIKKQDYTQETNFTPPIKNGINLFSDKYWFLNWYKILKQPKSQLDMSIKNWWSQILPSHGLNEVDGVKEKQRNSIEFADYCRALLKACELVYFSEIDRNIKIGGIQGSD